MKLLVILKKMMSKIMMFIDIVGEEIMELVVGIQHGNLPFQNYHLQDKFLSVVRGKNKQRDDTQRRIR